MAKDFKQIAENVLRLIGGEENITHFEHCSTRLRFTLADPEKADKETLKSTKGVMGVIAGGNQCQVVIGNDVIEVYDEMMKMGKFDGASGNQSGSGTTNNPQGKGTGKVNIGAWILDFMVGVFQPLVPAIAGAGILKALLTVFITFGWMSTDMTAYRVFYYVADAALYYLPLMVAITTANKLNANRLVALTVVAAMVYPDTISLLGSDGASFLGFHLQNISYSSQVFPAILTVVFVALLEHYLNKVSPKAIRVFFVPLVCFIVSFPVALIVLGPLGYNIGTLLTSAILALYNTFGWLAVAIVAAILPFMISLGMHKALVPYAVSAISNPGFDMLYLPASLAHNISEGGACLAVAVKTNDEDLRSAAISSGISGLFGITEPALYGVTLQHKKVLMSVCISSLIGGLFVGIMKIKAFAAVGPGIASMPMYIDPDNSMNFIYAVIGFGISIIVSFILTLILYKDEATIVGKESHGDAGGAEADSTGAFSKIPAEPSTKSYTDALETFNLNSPSNGQLINLSDVKDEVFSAGMLGDGMAIIPGDGRLYAPCDGLVDTVFDSKHAITLAARGAELLLHVGLDTVKLEGKFFTPKVSSGDRVKKGQLLMEFDLEEIKKAGYDTSICFVVTNSGDFDITKAESSSVTHENYIMQLTRED